jgi:hypothetical protein
MLLVYSESRKPEVVYYESRKRDLKTRPIYEFIYEFIKRK